MHAKTQLDGWIEQMELEQDDKPTGDRPLWMKVDEDLFAVRIDEKTTLGEFALSYFAKSIPFCVRRDWSSFRWAGDLHANGRRFGLIRVTWKGTPSI